NYPLNYPLISVVIPVYNGAFWLRDLIPALLDQSIASQCEFIFIDSGSQDESVTIISSYPVRLLYVEPADFNHGETRNFGVQQAGGEYVVMTVQDAMPAGKYWLENLLKGFVNPEVAGVCGIQVVPEGENTNPLAWYKPVSPGELV